MMQSVRDVFKFEWLQLRRSPIWRFLPFLHIILWVLLIIRYEIGSSGQGTRDYYFYKQWLTLMPVVMLLTGLYANYMLYRERCNGMDVLLRSWPQHGSSLIIGKWLLVQIFGLAFTVPLILMQAVWLAISGYPQEPVLLYAFYTGVQTGAALFTFSSLGMCLGGFIRNKFSFLLISCIWFIPVLVRRTSMTETPPLHVFWRWFAPYDLTRFRYNPVQDSYGLWGVEWTVIHQAAVLLLGVFFLGLACIGAYRHRCRRRESFIVCALALLLAMGFGWTSFREFAHRVNQYITDGISNITDGSKSAQTDGLAVVQHDFHIEEMKLNLHVNENESNYLSVESELRLKQTGKKPAAQLFLTLNRRLEVTALKGDRPLRWSRQGDVLEIVLNQPLNHGEYIDVTLNYAGNIDTYRSEGLRQFSGIDKHNVLLPKSVAWYPQIGQRQLIYSEEHNHASLGFIIKEGLSYKEPGVTHYEVIIEGRADKPLVMPLTRSVKENNIIKFQGKNDSGLFLYQGITEESLVQGVKVVDHLDRMSQSQRDVQTQLNQMEFLNVWLGLSLKPADLYSGYILSEGNLLDPDNEVYRIRFPWDFLKPPTVKPFLLNALLSWVYEHEYPGKSKEWKPGFHDYYVNEKSIKGIAKPNSLTDEEVRLITEISRLAENDWDRLLEISGDLYRKYENSPNQEDFDVLKELDHILFPAKAGEVP